VLSSRHLSALVLLLVCTALGAACTKPECPDDLEFFRTRLWEPVLSVQCAACHHAEGLAASTRLVLRSEQEPGGVEANFAMVRALAREQVGGRSVLVLKPIGEHPGGHMGGMLFAKDSSRYQDFQRFVDRVTGVPGACESTAELVCSRPDALDTTAWRRLRLLTRFEYDNTLKDLLYINSQWGKALPAETVVYGFDNNGDARAVDPLLADGLLTAAEEAAKAAMSQLSRHVTCSPGDACAQQFITRFGERAFRRPLTDSERARYQAFYTTVAREEGYTAGIQALITAMLQSPHFLYRSEIGERVEDKLYALTDWEIASQLSYLFWGTMPDAELFAKARAGELRTSEQIGAQAKRLLASPRSRAVLDHFATQWLELHHLDHAEKDAALFPQYTPSLRAAMKTETLELFDHVVRRGGGKLKELFSANYSFVTPELASFYELPGTAMGVTSTGLRHWGLSGTGRGGILTHGSLLASHATPLSSSPVRRGKLVRERLLCQPIPPPPPGLEVQLPPVDHRLPNRQRFSEHSRNAACVSCHRLMDPIGFGFEQFDSVGRYRPAPGGQEVDASGEVLSSRSTQGPFLGVDGLQGMLVESEDVQSCFSLQLLRFSYGVSGDEDPCLNRQVAKDFKEAGQSIPELLISMTKLPRFTLRADKPIPVEGEDDDSTSGGSGGGDSGSGGSSGGGSSGGGGSGGGGSGGGGSGGGGSLGPNNGIEAISTNNPALQVRVTEKTTWETGYCNTLRVTNAGTSEIQWQVTLQIRGTAYQFWESTVTLNGNQASFVGRSYNQKLKPGGWARFGYCAKL
jgi:hypothetical protein